MYQTAVIMETRLCAIAGPVCITLLAMRPAKSFWKNAQLCAPHASGSASGSCCVTLAAIA
jgi:hypothetical protein